MGTSLTVHPFATLPSMVNTDCPRVLINLQPAGNIGDKKNDVVLLGKCDEVVRDLCKELGWEEDLLKMWEATADTVEVAVGAEEVKEQIADREKVKKKEEEE